MFPSDRKSLGELKVILNFLIFYIKKIEKIYFILDRWVECI